MPPCDATDAPPDAPARVSWEGATGGALGGARAGAGGWYSCRCCCCRYSKCCWAVCLDSSRTRLSASSSVSPVMCTSRLDCSTACWTSLASRILAHTFAVSLILSVPDMPPAIRPPWKALNACCCWWWLWCCWCCMSCGWLWRSTGMWLWLPPAWVRVPPCGIVTPCPCPSSSFSSPMSSAVCGLSAGVKPREVGSIRLLCFSFCFSFLRCALRGGTAAAAGRSSCALPFSPSLRFPNVLRYLSSMSCASSCSCWSSGPWREGKPPWALSSSSTLACAVNL
mmetsp:Transcript_33524/g.83027  ORF Transcript_33524/g.83027 Transcript_33524/m.83027 type:complete len:281 (-) Transcript_33524:978-1820(-)